MLVENLNLADPPPAQALVAVRERFPHLPAEYFEYLGQHNGGEGPLGIHPGWFQLWPAERVAEYNDRYGLPEFLPDFSAIGSSGGGELFVFASAGAPADLFVVPAIGMCRETLVPVAPSFLQFVAAFGK